MARRIGMMLVLTIAAGCGGAATGTATPTTGPGGPSPAATPTPGAATPGPVAGTASASVDVGGELTVLNGGSCGGNEFPPDFGGGYGFYANIGVPTFRDPEGDYLGFVINVTGADPDGEYEVRWGMANGTLQVGGELINLGDIVLTISDDGRTATLESATREDATPVAVDITC